MTLRERDINFDEEIDRLLEEREQLAEEIVELPEGDGRRSQKAQRGMQLDAHLDGLEWARDTAHEDDDVPQWDEDVDSITLSGLTGGQLAAIEGEVSETQQSAQQVERVAKVRMCTIKAPYISDGMSKQQETAAVAGLPVGFLEWAANKVDELSSVGNGERPGFETLLVEKQTQ